jgi:hypothetical protein
VTTQRGLLIAVAAALTVSPLAAGTTAPSTSATVLVLLEDKGVTVNAYSESGGADRPVLGMLRGAIPRGDVLNFHVVNRGKKPHNFTIFGRKTKALKPGQQARFRIMATTRGRFPWKSTLDKGKKFRGFVSIF